MKEFIEKWNSDSKYKTKVKLGVSSLFVILVAIFAITSNGVNLERDFLFIYLDINIAHFGNTDIMSAVIDIYNGTSFGRI